MKTDTETVEQEAANRYTKRRLLDKEDREKELIKATREEEEVHEGGGRGSAQDKAQLRVHSWSVWSFQRVRV